MTTVNTTPTHEGARILYQRRVAATQGERLPETCRPTDVEQAWAIQNEISKRWCEEQDDSIGGWKCGLPSPDKIVVAPIYTRTINSIPPVAVVPKIFPSGNVVRIEPEFAFFFGKDLPPRNKPYSPADVDAAIIRTHLALEIIGCRYSEPSTCTFPEMLADGLVNLGLFIGPEIDSELARNANEFSINASFANQKQHYAAKHPAGNPRAPLYWLAEFLRTQGQGIVAGQAIITGSFAGVLEVPLNTDIELNYDGIGKLDTHFTLAKTFC